jgi:hypothetical protein
MTKNKNYAGGESHKIPVIDMRKFKYLMIFN